MGLQDEMQALKATSIEELQEQAEEVGFLTPREFAKLKGKQAQQVYGWVRKGTIESEKCKCGRTIIDVKKAEAALLRRDIALGRAIPPELDPKYQLPEGEEDGDAEGPDDGPIAVSGA